ncbi:MAG: helix-turn-helix domain-containing protein [Deltaproteobacteria bacterium]|nr:helix-turn-helix domain-containing protein [Deltaproteobacteria bacterium]
MTAHLGATLRLFRLESGLSLRDLARRLGVSSTYLSRVENGIDAPPTSLRLEAMARELGVPPTLLIELAHRVSPLLVDYVAREPDAGSLFLDIAHRRLNRTQLAELRAVLDARFPTRRKPTPPAYRLSELLTSDRILVQLRCADLEDVFDVAVERLATGTTADPVTVVAALLRREAVVSSSIGHGVAVPCAYVEAASPSAAVVSLARPLRRATPDGQAVRLVIVLWGSTHAGDRMAGLASIARLSARGLADQLASLDSPARVLARLAELELTASVELS